MTLPKHNARHGAEGKDLFVLLTGHGWCSSCEFLDREVLQKPEFVREVSPNFVWVELDFTFGDSEKKARERVLRELQKRFLAPGVPLVVLLDREGMPYAYAVDGYDAGTGPQRILARVKACRVARTLRDKEFAAARKATHWNGRSGCMPGFRRSRRFSDRSKIMATIRCWPFIRKSCPRSGNWMLPTAG